MDHFGGATMAAALRPEHLRHPLAVDDQRQAGEGEREENRHPGGIPGCNAGAAGNGGECETGAAPGEVTPRHPHLVAASSPITTRPAPARAAETMARRSARRGRCQSTMSAGNSASSNSA